MDPLATARRTLRDAVAASLADDVEIEIETPPDPELGDLAVPCHPLAPRLQQDPASIAERLAADVPTDGPIAEVRAEGPYLNAFVDAGWLAEATIGAVLEEGDDFGLGPDRDRRVVLEHTSANPTGPFHVGRARNPIVGDTLARILDAAGWDVRSEYYVNDVGRQAAILAFGLEHLDEDDLDPLERDKADHRLVRYYRAANERVESDPDAEKAVTQLLQDLEQGDASRLAEVREATGAVLEGMRETLQRIDVRMDGYVWESRYIQDRSVERVVDELKRADGADQDDGAWYIDLEPYGIHGDDPRFFFTRADGTSLYTTRDVAYHLDKIDRAGPGGRVVTVLGEDHKLQSRMLAVAMSLVRDGSELTDRGLRTADGTEYAPVFYAFVSLPEGKMSTRRGRVVHLDDLLDEAVERARAEVQARRDDLSDEEIQEIAETVGVDAVRYNIVDVQPEKAMTFRWEDALSFEGEAAPFCQYSHARAASILRKAEAEGLEPDVDAADLPDDARTLVKTVAALPGVVEKAARELKPHLVSGYTHELAQAFNGFYRDVPVLDAPTTDDVQARLALVQATRQVLANALELVGVTPLDRM